MYENIFKDFENSLQPALSLVEINRQMLEKMTSLHTECLSDCIKTGMEQFNAFSGLTDASSATAAQIDFIKAYEAKFATVSELDAAILMEASEAIQALVTDSFKQMTESYPYKEFYSEVSIDPMEILKTATEVFSSVAPVAATPASMAKATTTATTTTSTPAAPAAPTTAAKPNPTPAKRAVPKTVAKPAAKKAPVKTTSSPASKKTMASTTAKEPTTDKTEASKPATTAPASKA